MVRNKEFRAGNGGMVSARWMLWRQYVVIVTEFSLFRRHCVPGPVSFHRNNFLRDNEVDRDSGAQIKDALLNALPVERFFGHPYLAPGTTPNMFFMLSVTPDQ